MVIYEQWDVVVVPFPFVDIPVQKYRPALIVSVSAANRQNDHTLLSMMTTVARSHWLSDIVISDMKDAGLNSPSLVRCKLFTLPNDLIVRQIGHLSPADQHACEQMFRSLLNFR